MEQEPFKFSKNPICSAMGWAAPKEDHHYIIYHRNEMVGSLTYDHHAALGSSAEVLFAMDERRHSCNPSSAKEHIFTALIQLLFTKKSNEQHKGRNKYLRPILTHLTIKEVKDQNA